MLRRAFFRFTVVAFLLGATLLTFPAARSALGEAPPPPSSYIAPAVQIPDDYVTPQVELSNSPDSVPQTTGAKAVVIVGTDTAQFQTYMENAASLLRDNGVQVRTFYSAQDDFGWSDVVNAATGASYLIYAGHGVGSGDHPTKLGTFYLGPGDGEFVGPEAVRQDLADRLAGDAVVIFNHACYTAGSPGDITQEEARRRVAMYAEPFVDIGIRAYFANNYYNSASWIVSEILEAWETNATLEDVFKSVYPYSADKFRDLDHPADGYDLWLNGETGDWNYAFVGQPSYAFAHSELGGLPSEVAFSYNTATEQLKPPGEVVTPTNVGNSDPLQWTAAAANSWFTLTPTSGESPDDALAVEPVIASVETLPAGQYTSAFTVTVTDPADTLSAVQRVNVRLDVVTPRLGNVPAALGFTYLLSDTHLFPSTHVVTPMNIGSTDVLTWELAQTGTWFNVSAISGTTPAPFTITPISYTTTQEMTYTGNVTVTIIAPTGTADAVQRIDLSLQVRAGSVEQVFLPLVTRD